MRVVFLSFAVFLLCAAPGVAHACACGCGVFDVGTGDMYATRAGGTVSLEYDYMDQDRNWHGTSSAPAANNDDKDIRSSFYTAGVQYMFNRTWGLRATVPYWDRHFTTDDGGVMSFNHAALGDARITGIYTGLSDNMSTGLIFGVKLPTGDYTYANFDRDTSIGTGSTDALLGLYHMGYFPVKDWAWFAQGMADVPVLARGGYTPGSEFTVAAGGYYESWHAGQVRIVPTAKLIASDRLSDSGPQSDAPNSGYRRVLVAPGVEFDLGKTTLYADVAVPVYQDVRGDQLTARTLFKLVASYHF